MEALRLNDKPYTAQQLIDLPETLAQTGWNDYEKRVLTFCRQWLSGQAAFTLQTSGSTGRPKPVTLSRAQMIASARLTGQALGLAAGDRALVCLSADYIAGRMMLVRGFVLGLHLTIIEPAGNPLAPFSAETHFDFTALVPLQLQTILTETPDKLPLLNRMKAILIGGAPVSAALYDHLQRVTAPIYHTYGMTETVSHIALRRLNGPQADDYFIPFEGVDLGLDERGCLTITAPLTGGKTLRTHDRVLLRPDGSFRWLGRFDHVINTGGVKVQAEKVELALERFFLHYQNGRYAERRFFVGPLDHPRLGQAVVVVIEGQPDEEAAAPALTDDIRARLRPALTKYELPRGVYFLDRFQETPTGKIDRPATLEQLKRTAAP